MPFDVATYLAKSSETNSFLRPSKWLLVMPPPPGLSDNSFQQSATRNLQFTCDVKDVPGVDFALHQVRRYGYGPIEKKPWAPLFNECQISVRCDGDGLQWTFFRKWMTSIFNFHRGYNISAQTADDPMTVGGQQIDTYEVAYKADYMVDIGLCGYSNAGEEILRIILREAYPISMTNMRTDWADGQQILRFGILLSYIDWYQDILPAQKSYGASGLADNPTGIEGPGSNTVDTSSTSTIVGP